MNYNPNCGRCGMLNHWGQCQLTACRFPVQESGVINGSAYVAKIVTNADRLRNMTNEELAEWLCDIAGWLPMYEGKMHPILDWLKQEAID